MTNRGSGKYNLEISHFAFVLNSFLTGSKQTNKFKEEKLGFVVSELVAGKFKQDRST